MTNKLIAFGHISKKNFQLMINKLNGSGVYIFLLQLHLPILTT